MDKPKKKAILNGLGIVGVLGGTTALVVLGFFNAGAFILAAIACYPMAKHLWGYAGYMREDTIRILRKALPKAGFSIEMSKWNDEHTAISFHGKYLGDNFIVEAVKGWAYIRIFDLPWHAVKSSTPSVSLLLESLNDLNAESPNTSVVMGEPDKDGMRPIYTVSMTILPASQPDKYLGYLMRDMLKRKKELTDAMMKDRPYMNQRRERGPIGFTPQQNSSGEEDDTISPAAKTNSEAND